MVELVPKDGSIGLHPLISTEHSEHIVKHS